MLTYPNATATQYRDLYERPKTNNSHHEQVGACQTEAIYNLLISILA